MEIRKHLLKLLSDGEFHSGEALGQALGVSRMAVWKHLKALRERGISFEIVRGKGYRLPAPIELLDDQLILSGVTAETRARLGPVEVLLAVDSTNNRLREQALNGAPSGAVCVAEQQ
ncbi:MAG: biotin operon repressor, partial [Gammaproteobacteria bacterium]|nr:biotin operon repressor [Gammaproteobacteria bacterium]